MGQIGLPGRNKRAGRSVRVQGILRGGDDSGRAQDGLAGAAERAVDLACGEVAETCVIFMFVWSGCVCNRFY